MQKLLQFLDRNQHGTGLEAPLAKGLKPIAAASAAGDCQCNCQCDCYECAGGDTSE